MFQFSNLLIKPDAEERRCRASKSIEAIACSNYEAEQSGKDSIEVPAASACISERARRDLDEQLMRLAELLNRVESLDFGQDALDGGSFTLAAHAPSDQFPSMGPQAEHTHEPLPEFMTPLTASENHADSPIENEHTDDAWHSAEADQDEFARPAPNSKLIECDIVLSSGAFSQLEELPVSVGESQSDLPKSTRPAPKTDATMSVDEPFTIAASIRRRVELGSGFIQDYHASASSRESTDAGESTALTAESELAFPNESVPHTCQPIVEMTQPVWEESGSVDFPVVQELPFASATTDVISMSAPSSLEGASETASEDTVESEPVRSEQPAVAVWPAAAASVSSIVTAESPALNLLAALAGLLTLTTLVYVVADLAGWL